MMETNDQAFMKVNAIVILLVDIVSSSRDFSIAHRARVWEKKNLDAATSKVNFFSERSCSHLSRSNTSVWFS